MQSAQHKYFQLCAKLAMTFPSQIAKEAADIAVSLIRMSSAPVAVEIVEALEMRIAEEYRIRGELPNDDTRKLLESVAIWVGKNSNPVLWD